jgi:hypothetical protein
MGAKMMDFLRGNALFLGFLAVLVVGFLFLRTRGSNLGSVDEFDALVASGEPVVVEFYSNT